MRWFVLSLVICFLPLMGEEPGGVALAVMQDLRKSDEQSKIVDRLGISRFCGPRKRESIEEHWQARASWAEDGKFSFQLLDEKIDDDLAAVLIGAATPNSPDLSTVIPLALVKTGGKWKVAPVEGSFENAGLGFGAEVRARAGALEYWLSGEQVVATVRLQRAEMEKFKKAMEGAVPEEDLRGFGARKVLESFIKAAEEGNTEAMIVWQGYFERDEFPNLNWEQHLRATRLGVNGEDRQNVWRLLTSKQVLKVVLDDEDRNSDGEANLLVGFLSPFETGTMNDNLNPVRFPMKKTMAGWRVGLPVFFSLADEDSRAFRNARNQDFNWEDRTGVRRIFRAFEERYEKIREKEAGSVIEGLLKDAAAGDLTTFLRRHYRYVEEKKEDQEEEGAEAEDDGEPLLQQRIIGGRGRNEPDEKRQSLYLEVIKWWSELHHDRRATEGELSGLFVEGKIALAILSLPPSSDTWKPVYQRVWLGWRQDGWMILPGRERPMLATYPAEEKEAIHRLAERYETELERITEEFLQNVLKEVTIDAGKGEAAHAELATKLVTDWRRVARNGGMLPLLKMSAVRERPEKAKDLLRDVGYLRKGAASAHEPDQVLGSQASGRFRAVSLASVVANGKEMQCPLFFVVPVEGGFRVLVDVELPLEVNRGISLLNEDRMDALSEALSKEDFAAITDLREWHQKTARPIWEKWNREREAADQ